MKKIVLFALALGLGLSSASAQFTTGGKSSSGIHNGSGNSAESESYNVFIGSYAFDRYSYSGPGTSSLKSFTINGGKLTYLHGFSISQQLPLFIETGANIFFGAGNEKLELGYYDAVNTYLMASLSVPANLAYRFQINDFFAIKPYVGINAKLNLLGKFYTTISDTASDWANLYDEDSSWNRFQLGWQIGTDFEITKVILGLNIGTDFIPAAKAESIKINCMTFDLRFGYLF